VVEVNKVGDFMRDHEAPDIRRREYQPPAQPDFAL